MNYFCLYRDMEETFADLSDEEAGQVIKSLLAYCNRGELPSLTGGAKIVFGLLRRQYERDAETYKAKCERLSANGKLGGRPKAIAVTEKQEKPEETNEKQMVFSESKKSQDKEEEKEEDKEKDKKKKTICSESKHDSEPEFCKMILNNGTYHVVTVPDVQHMKELYPAVNVEAELRKMIGWCESNQQRRKTARGIERFIHSWLAREQDKGHVVSTPKGKVVTETLYDQRPNNEPDSEEVPQWLRERMIHKLA